MTPEEAREIAKNTHRKDKLKMNDNIDISTKELLEVSRAFIKSACIDGKFNTMVCSRYRSDNKKEYDILTSANYRVKTILEKEGYTCDAYDNSGISSINLTISWSI